ncbi:MAG: DoxX family protein [Gammaproteobacteria bacterium]
MANLNTNLLLLIGRILFSFIFIFSGAGKIFGFAGTVAYMENAGVSFYPSLFAIVAIIFELGGGVLVLLGWHTRLAAALLFIFTLAVSFVIHHFWSYPPEVAQIQMIMFMKNMAMMGGALYIYSFGAGAYSLDARLKK